MFETSIDPDALMALDNWIVDNAGICTVFVVLSILVFLAAVYRFDKINSSLFDDDTTPKSKVEKALELIFAIFAGIGLVLGIFGLLLSFNSLADGNWVIVLYAVCGIGVGICAWVTATHI